MLFEVVQPDAPNDVMFYTEYVEALPDDEELKNIRQAGYRFKINGKFVDKEKILTLVKELRADGR